MFSPNFSGFHSVNTIGRISRSRRHRNCYITIDAADLTDNEQNDKIPTVPVKLECDIENPDEVYMNAVYLAVIMIFAIGTFLIIKG